MGKGSNRRPESDGSYVDKYDAIFKKPVVKEGEVEKAVLSEAWDGYWEEKRDESTD